MDGEQNGRYRIHPITHSLIIFNFTQADIDLHEQPFKCIVNSTDGEKSTTFGSLEIINSGLLAMRCLGSNFI